MPFGLKQSIVGQAHQQRIKRAGLQLRLLKQIIAVPPCVRMSKQRFENEQGLPRGMRAARHDNNSTYVDYSVNC